MLVANIFKQLSRFMVVLGLALLTLPSASAWSLFGQPQNEPECLLQNLKGVNDKFVAQMIVAACEELFPLKTQAKNKCTERDLTQSELKQLEWTKGESSYATGPYFSVRLYNGNKKINITAATIEISYPNKNPFTFDEAKVVAKHSKQQYDLFFSNTISPNSADSLGKSILEIPSAGWSWKVVSVKTCS
jgi:hypothetical protein